MLFVDLFGRMFKASYPFLNMLYQHHQKYLRLHIQPDNWYGTSFVQSFVMECLVGEATNPVFFQAYVDAVYGHKFQLGHANHAWLCLDLLNVLCQLAERGHGSSVQSMLEYPLKHCPEILLLGLAHVNVLFFSYPFKKKELFFSWCAFLLYGFLLFLCVVSIDWWILCWVLQTTYNVLQYEVSSVAFPLIVGSSVGNGMIFHLWHVNPDLVLRGFVDVHIIDPNNMTRILDICKELKVKLE